MKKSLCHLDLLTNICHYSPENNCKYYSLQLKIKKILINVHTKMYREITDIVVFKKKLLNFM